MSLDPYILEARDSVNEFEERAESRIRTLASYQHQKELDAELGITQEQYENEMVEKTGSTIHMAIDASEDIENVEKILRHGVDQADQYIAEIQGTVGYKDREVEEEMLDSALFELPQPSEIEYLEDLAQTYAESRERLVEVEKDFYEWAQDREDVEVIPTEATPSIIQSRYPSYQANQLEKTEEVRKLIQEIR